ncbi:MAG: hypothetical protein WCP55_11850, partial [Lentisphaerota bacterium]
AIPVLKHILVKAAAGKIIMTASRDNTRRVLTSVYLEKDAAIATDGKQIVKLFCDVPVDAPIIVPPTKVLAAGMLRDDGAAWEYL